MTHQEIIETFLPSPYREQAIENINNYDKRIPFTTGKDYLNDNCHDNVVDILACGFNWTNSSQKADYWYDICKRAKAGEFDPPQDPSVTLPREDWEALIKMVDHSSHVAPERIIDSIKSQLNPN